MLLIEFTTNKNFTRQSGGVVKSKITRYRKYLPDIEEWAERQVTVLFVIDCKSDDVRRFVLRQKHLLDDSVAYGATFDGRYPFLECYRER